MNEAKAKKALHDLAQASADLASMCDRDVTDFAAPWHAVGRNAHALEHESLHDHESDIGALLAAVASLFSHHPGGFMEAYVSRASYDEQVEANAKFDALKELVAAAAGDLRDALAET